MHGRVPVQFLYKSREVRDNCIVCVLVSISGFTDDFKLSGLKKTEALKMELQTNSDLACKGLYNTG